MTSRPLSKYCPDHGDPWTLFSSQQSVMPLYKCYCIAELINEHAHDLADGRVPPGPRWKGLGMHQPEFRRWTGPGTHAAAYLPGVPLTRPIYEIAMRDMDNAEQKRVVCTCGACKTSGALPVKGGGHDWWCDLERT